jgi:acyl carrier protein
MVAQVTEVLVDTFGVDPARVKLDASLVGDLDLDSIDAIDMVMRLQERTGRSFDEDALRRIRTVGDLVGMLEQPVGTEGLRPTAPPRIL